MGTGQNNIDYTNRISYTIGKQLGILLGGTGSDLNRPLQEKYNTSSFTGIDITTFTGTIGGNVNIGNLKVVFNNNNSDNIVGTGVVLTRLAGIYNQKIQILMATCTSGWKDIGSTPSGSLAAGCPTNLCRICESSQEIIEIGSAVLSPSCTSGWEEIGTVTTGANSVYCPTVGGALCKVCKKINNNILEKGFTTLMSSCPFGYNDLGPTPSGSASAGCPTNLCRICQKN